MKKLFTMFLLAASLSAFSVDVTFTLHYSGTLTKDTMFIVGDISAWAFMPMIDLGDGEYSYTATLDAGDTLQYYYITVNSWDSAGNQDWTYYTRYRETIDVSCKGQLTDSVDRPLIVPSKDTEIIDYWAECPGYTAPVNINSNYVNNSIGVYPNPSNGLVTLDLSSFNSEVVINVLDITGKVLLKTQSSGKAMEIDLTSLPASLYFIKAFDGKNSVYQKIILK